MYRYFLFIDMETGEEFVVDARNVFEAEDIALDYFNEPVYQYEMTGYEAEMSGLDEYY